MMSSITPVSPSSEASHRCHTCRKRIGITHQVIDCDYCRKWYHALCENVRPSLFIAKIDDPSRVTWCCSRCSCSANRNEAEFTSSPGFIPCYHQINPETYQDATRSRTTGLSRHSRRGRYFFDVGTQCDMLTPNSSLFTHTVKKLPNACCNRLKRIANLKISKNSDEHRRKLSNDASSKQTNNKNVTFIRSNTDDDRDQTWRSDSMLITNPPFMDYEELPQLTAKEAQAAFSVIDHDRNGLISKDELISAMKAIGEQPTEEEIDIIFRNVDTDRSGFIDYAEFLQMLKHRRPSRKSLIVDPEALFKVFDRNNDGYISVDEIQVAMADLGEELSVAEACAMVSEADVDGDGRISFREFEGLVNLQWTLLQHRRSLLEELTN